MSSRKARPILFSGPMIRALLEGRKTQTRRVVKGVDPKEYPYCGSFGEIDFLPAITFQDHAGDSAINRITAKCPYGQPGDLVWVRETHCWGGHEGEEGWLYRATNDCHVVLQDGDGWTVTNEDGSERSAWKPSIHMPRWANRLTLEITDVRVEKLQDIGEEDAKAEGLLRGDPIPEIPSSKGIIYSSGVGDLSSPFAWTRNPVAAFSDLWKEINGPESWQQNSWVWALTFKVHHQNIDAFLQEREAA